MAGAEESHLSVRQNGYDFVVASTQQSLNTGLKEFFDKFGQPPVEVCFIVDSNGAIVETITLDELKERSGGVDPFTIPHGTDWNDERIQALFNVRFMVGFQFQIGLPGPPSEYKELPDIIELGENARNIGFRLMCKEFIIVINNPPGGWGAPGSWDVFKQSDEVNGKSQRWFFETSVNLVREDLPNNLDTFYFDTHPEEKAAILRALENLSGTAFSLQQLMFDLDSTVVQRIPDIKGIPPESTAYRALDQYFKNYYVGQTRRDGLPLLGITAVAEEDDPSQLVMTAYERQVTSHNNPAASTLDNVCMTNDRSLPAAYAFDWNWVTEDQIEDGVHGALAINRTILSNIFAEQLLKPIPEFCCKFYAFWTRSHPPVLLGAVFEPGQNPDIQMNPTGDTPLEMRYDFKVKEVQESRDFSSEGWEASEEYICSLSMERSSVTVKHRIEFNLKGIQDFNSHCGSLTIEVKYNYTLTVDAGGTLRLSGNDPTILTWDELDAGAFDQYKLGRAVDEIREFADMIVNDSLEDRPFNQLQSFVFPGSKVFMFTNARFSDYQDLVCDLRYLAPAGSNGKSALEDATGLRITHSSELMENYLHTEVQLPPPGHFEALQTNNENGHALVFAVGSNGTLYTWQECSGETTTGWKRHDLSSLTLKRHFAPEDDAKVRRFSVGQSHLNGSIGVAMGVDTGGVDILYISLGNSSSDVSWVKWPTWTLVPFDGDSDHGKDLRIANIMFSETFDNVQYLMVDINNDASGHQVVRYHIDPSRSTGKAWVKHDLAIDLDPGAYHSVVGRKHNEHVDGVYTAGNISGEPQLIYEPIINVYGEGSPTVTRLKLPDRELPTAIATVRYTDTSSALYAATDLYVIAGSTLYRYPADKQTNDAVGDAILEEEIFSGTDSLYAMEFEGVVTLWGRNAAKEVYYVSCYVDEVTDSASWSYPVPLLSDVVRISPYVNRVDGGNTIFAYSEDRLTSITQATNTKAKIWKAQSIQMEPAPKPQPEPAKSFLSYSTTIALLDTNDQPVPDTMISLWADSRTPAYVNGQYYVLGGKETRVPTDSSGLITVVEATDDVCGSILSVCLPRDSKTTVINPMDKSFGRVSDLDSADSIRKATYPAKVVAGGVIDEDEEPLIDPETAQLDIESVAESMRKLKEAYDDVEPPTRTSKLFYREEAPRVVRRGRVEKGPDNIWNFWSAAGDLFRWAKKKIEKLVEIVKDAITGVWKFVVQIGGKVYQAMLDAVDAVVGTVVLVFNAIKTTVEAIVHFMQFLFQWNDIKRTEQVLHNIVKLYLKHQVDQIDTARVVFGKHIDDVGEKIREWGGITDWSSLGDIANLPPDSSGQNPTSGHTPTSLLFANHFRNQWENIQVKSALPDMTSHSEADELIKALLDAISEEGEVLSTFYEDLQEVAAGFKSLNVGDIIKKIAAILVSALVSSAKVVVEALFRVLSVLAESALDLLDVKLHIPVISDILNEIGISEISLLELFCWIGAVGCTVVYRIINDEAPFPDTSDVNAMISASSWSELEAVFNRQPATKSKSDQPGDKEPTESLKHWQKIVHSVGHGASSFLLFATTFVSDIEALDSRPENPAGIYAAGLSICIAGSQAGAALLAPRYPVENLAVSMLSGSTSLAVIVTSIVCSGFVQNFAASHSRFRGMALDDGRATGAIIKSILIFPALAVTGWHLSELGEKPAGQERSAAIVGEVTNIASHIATVSYAVAVNVYDIPDKLIPVGVMAAANLTGTGLQAARAALKD
ncbi:hypothetical protein P875_00108865 [Aspergillus parasiticus SU-1]|uniref:Uncharacterized protein n=1 Tax=Aspergillus parasiticus (strain ATCC 56775 / NRRL 5862 / SRRC 143 / SU-1) TaxID=1403190 RepID=A0A0F0IJH6_ASPPU|nr:hypothetical protein P875_00108865 [Aspergillus parasiticus SU-1]